MSAEKDWAKTQMSVFLSNIDTVPHLLFSWSTGNIRIAHVIMCYHVIGPMDNGLSQ